MATKSSTQTATSFSTQKLLSPSPPTPLIMEPPQDPKPHNSRDICRSPPKYAIRKSLDTSPVNVPRLKKMSSNPLNEYFRASTEPPPSTSSRLQVSRSAQASADSDDEEQSERNFGSISPILQRSPSNSLVPSPYLSPLGAARATNFRSKFRKSHTCGSLFANCSCSSAPQFVQVPITVHAPTTSPSSSQDVPAVPGAIETIETIETTTTTPPNNSFHLSISPSDFSTSPTTPSSTGATRNTNSTTSGYHSTLSTQTSSATNVSLQLSRDESMGASFDYVPSTPLQPISPRTARTAFILGSASSNDSSNSYCEQLNNQSTTSTEQASIETGTSNQHRKRQLRISKTTTNLDSPPTTSRKSETLPKTKQLFHTYSHPDTDFIFTDANKHPSRESLTQFDSASGTHIDSKHTKRSSSPNISYYRTLDVAVHPDIPVKSSPKHSPLPDARRTQSPLRIRSIQQRRRLLQRSHEIESGGSTSESEYATDIRSPTEIVSGAELAGSSSKQLPNEKSCATSQVKSAPENTANASKNQEDESFVAAQKYFAESGILGPCNTSSSHLIRKTSKILQDFNVHEQIRKTSMILRAGPQANGSKRNSTITSPTSITGTEFQQPISVQPKLTLKLRSNNNVDMETPANRIYSPTHRSTPQSPHTLATTCGFSPNLATQSCIITDDRDAQIKSLHGEVVSLKDVIKSRDAEIVKLRREIHKLKSVLQQTANAIPLAKDELLQSPTKTPPQHLQQPQPVCMCCRKNVSGGLTAACPKSGANAAATATESDSSSSDTAQSCKAASTCTGTTPVTCALSAAGSFADGSNSSTDGGGLDAAAMKNAGLLPVPSAAAALAPPTLQCNGDAAKAHPPQHTQHATTLQQQQQQQQLQLQATVLKKQGVSGESCEISKHPSISQPIEKFDKDYSSKQLIKEAIMDNDFLKNIDASQVRELVEAMYPLSVAKGEFVIQEGEAGAHLYVSAEGEFEVVKNGKVLGVMGPGKAFGELAILYNCTRTASIRVLCDARVWVLDRRVFQHIMMRTGIQRIENSVNFLKSVPLLKNLSEELLAKIADVLEVEFYPAGTYIIRQGASGDTFFLISQGSVKVTQKVLPSSEEKEIRTLERGDYFGEQALINEDKRTANIIAMAPGVECLTLDRESFTHLIGDLCELKEKNYGDENRVLAMKFAEKTKEIFGSNVKQEFPEMKLTDLEVVATLGIGGFGRVELVKAYRENSVDIFALKCLKKRHIVDTKQEEHIFSERTIMLSCDSPFICRLYRTFRDEKYVYMLLEACMGGEIWTMLRDRGAFAENAAQFIIGCVLQAFEYLHARGIIYRDLKPENLMLDERGYVKLVDFGFAKYIGYSSKTWTFCGTPEYVAPEIILNKGHDRAVDYWALGVLIHELLSGTPPFTANDPMKTYNIILKGIDMIDFPKHMSRSAVMLIKRLCRDVPAERLGYQKGGMQDIKKHKWFLGFDWDGLQSQTLIPPFVRPISHPTDTAYFDIFPCDPEEPPDEFSGWDADF